MPTPDVSIIVPTRDRPDALAGCLAALERQTGCGLFEIIVVDDGSKEEARVAAAVARAPHARLLRQRGAGPAAARNNGARAARAPILCFTDDDCEPITEWAAILAQTVRGGADAVAGGVVDIRPASPHQLAMRSLGRALIQTDEGEPRFIGSLNMACRADVFREVPFDERYPFASEDRDWSLRISAGGYRIARNRDARIVHMREDSLAGFLRRHMRYGEGSYVFRKAHSGGHPGPARLYGQMVQNGFRHGPRVGALVVLSQLATAVGFARAARADRRGKAGRSPTVR